MSAIEINRDVANKVCGLLNDVISSSLFNSVGNPDACQKWAAAYAFVFPVLCARCGTLWPEFFKVPDDEWIKYIPPRERDMVICRPCYDWIKKVIDEARQG